MPAWSVHRLDDETSGILAAWRYPGRLSTYDVTAPLDPDVTVVLRDPSGALVGYVVVDHEARVRGQAADPDLVDVGWGMAPARVGTGLGRELAQSAVRHAGAIARERGCRGLRAAILDWNGASLAVAAAGGLVPVGELTNGEGRFVILEGPIPAG